jgi:hypothetical protein
MLHHILEDGENTMTATYFKLILLALSLLCFPALSAASYSEQLSMHFHDINMQSRRSEPVTIFLKKELKNRYPDLDISTFELKKVLVVAKSNKGRGIVKLYIGNDVIDENVISPTPHSFRNPSQYTFEQISIRNRTDHSNGPWQLQFSGNIILRKIILFVERDFYISPDPYLRENDRNDHYGKLPKESLQGPPLPLVLPGRAWGTELEGEKVCGQQSRNIRDGWDFPDTICQTDSRATYRQGYRPVQIFLRPDIRPLDYVQLRHNVRDLLVSATVSAGSQDHPVNSVSAILGIEIAGHTYTRNISINNRANWRKRSKTESLEISGNWTRRDLQNARIFILPQRNCGDFTVQQIQLSVTRIR